MRITINKAGKTKSPLTHRELTCACRCFAQRSARRIKAELWNTIDIILTDDAVMAEVNAGILNHQGPTDVITQYYDALPGEPSGGNGEIYINIDEVRRHANPQHELLLYLAHGCDHLSGATDKTPAARQTMRRRELGWIRDYLATTAAE